MSQRDFLDTSQGDRLDPSQGHHLKLSQGADLDPSLGANLVLGTTGEHHSTSTTAVSCHSPNVAEDKGELIVPSLTSREILGEAMLLICTRLDMVK